MSPYPVKVTVPAIVDRAREMIVQEGYDGLTLARLAAALGIRAPSLYNHFRDKSELVREINRMTYVALTAAMMDARIPDAEPVEAFLNMMRAYRGFASRNAVLYRLAFVSMSDGELFDREVYAALAQPMQEVVAQLCGEERALPVLRGAWALAHGFAMLEMSAQFNRGGSLDEAYEAAIATYLTGIISRANDDLLRL
ncbi:MAG: TetR/AcrR family transcriptional regulator [Pleurocapsa minor GSE-CHR-MK-17-07R]|jgi:AcrR family transcriptional regulator|nr:TetR/AcrR family transcriptional regulator [Pleurocapsa minor GSE-CHR-MK 17-07R]